MKQKFNITGMTCSACSSKVEKTVNGLDGIKQASVNLLTNTMQVEYDDTKLSHQDIINSVEKVGYGAFSESSNSKQNTKSATDIANEHTKQIKTRLWISFIFLIPLFYISMGTMWWDLPLPAVLSGHKNAVSFAFLQFLLTLPIIYVNRNYFINGFSSLWHKSPNMDSLIAVGAGAAMVYGVFAIFRMSWGLGQMDMELVGKYHMDLYFESAGTILALITLGKYLEAKSKGKTSEALSKLIDMAPKTAVILKDGQEVTVPIEQVSVGDILVVKPGMSIPVDGIVIEGATSVDQAAVTGESIPVEKQIGDSVIGATINKTGYIQIKASKVGDDTTFAQIIKLVEEASATKAPIAQMADKVSGIFVPVVMVIALVSAIVWLLMGQSFEFALASAITVLVISCPCALGLATPVAIMVGTGKGAENGVLIKSGEALEIAHNVKAVVLDKTGTITQGKPVVTDIIPVNMTENALLEIAAGLESKSEHPLALSIMEYTQEKNITPLAVENFEAILGKGIVAQIENDKYFAGNALMFKENGIDIQSNQATIDSLADMGKTPLLFAKNTTLIGIIAVADVVKSTSAQAIKELRKMGIDVIMLTGDNKRTAQGIARELELDDVIAEVLPQDKEKAISDLQAKGKVVAMVGDGVNDAPALVRADVGIAIGAGTDVAVESADIVLMKNDLLDVVTAIRLSKSVIRNIKQNLFWAFFYNAMGIPLAAGVFYLSFGWRLNPDFAALAMSFSSIFVVANSLRLRSFKSSYKQINNISSNVSNSHIQIDENKKDIKKEYNMIIKISGMSCGHCVANAKKAISAVEGVTNVEVNLEKAQAEVTAPKSSSEAIVKAIEEAGYLVTEIIL